MSHASKSKGSSAQGDGVGADEDGEDQEDSSSFSSSSPSDHSKNAELESFRARWRKELQSAPVSQSQNVSKQIKESQDDSEQTDEEKARKLFMKGVENEQQGKLYEAIQFYRRAVQLVPDIEWRLYESSNQRAVLESFEREQEEAEEDSLNLEEESEVEEFDPSQSDLMSHLQRVLSKSCCIFQEKLPKKSTHISSLPVEIILYILRWVVSSDLDMRSLDMCSAVSRGFYVCSRDPEIWRLACIRVWGVNCGGLSEYKTWREMFISRPRLHFNGCYISKTTYVRSGENSFQDQFYRPWHLVQYFRYLRFFPEGLVLMLTTAEEPTSCLGLLKGRQARHPGIMVGHYRLMEDRVTLTVQKQDTLLANKLRSRRNNNTQEQTFHLEFTIVPNRLKKHAQLRWRCYSVFTKSRSGHETSSAFEVVGSRFPPLSFSRVKSYTAEADYPLM